MKSKRKKRTSTSPFGTSGRASHDATRFYDARLYKEFIKRESGKEDQNVPSGVLDTIICATSEAMKDLPDRSVHLMITSPPYNVSKEYDEDFTLDEYRAMLRRVFRETFRVLVDGGRACVNVANIGRKPYLPLHSFILQDMIEMGFLMRGEVIWNKSSSAGPSTAWGSWKSPANPTLRDVHEYILIFSKTAFARNGHTGASSITRDEFLEFTKSVWEFPAESARRIGHPAPFPIELPRRLIQLYSYEGDVILDPFAGSGTTCVAAMRCGRQFVGYEKNPDYARLAEGRIEQERQPGTIRTRKI